mmetsp:Transcript_55259/g.171182  ORF Transcript_55259/g.171182 Transcript_55259/m.171182 type:complete len:527 (+) Transcript_55259:140-1720(+)
MFDFPKPEATTVIRWLLRVVLVVFLAWLVRRRPEQEEEEEEVEQSPVRRTASGVKSRGVAAPRRPPQPRRDPYPPTIRQRRAPGEPVDFDAVIDKISKPKEMWEVRRDGVAPQIPRRDRPQEAETPTSSVPTSAPSVRTPLQLAPKSSKASGEAKGNTLHGHERPVTFITWNRDCNLLFTCGKDKIVNVWSFPDGELLGSYGGHSGAVWACSVTTDSRWLVTSGADRLVIVWEARTSRELARVELPGVVRYVEWAGAGGGSNGSTERFVTCHNRFGAHPPAVMVWRFDGTAIEELLRIVDLPTAATQVRWGRGDYLVASAHDNGELVFWRADTGAEVRRLKAHEASISKFDFSSDRELVATASHDKSVRVWDLGKGSDWKMLYKADTDRPLNAVALGPLTRAVAAGAPGQRPAHCSVIAAGGQDVRDVAATSSATDQFGTLLFRLGAGESLPSPLQADGVTKGHFGPVHTLSFARDGSAIASGSEDGCVRIHIFEANQSSSPAAGADAAEAPPSGPAADQDKKEEG